MDGESFISPVVDLFREILYDIVGLFVPGAALLLILHTSSFQFIHDLVEPITRVDSNMRLALFIGASYVTGYAVQGFAGRIWGLVIVRIVGKVKQVCNVLKERWKNSGFVRSLFSVAAWRALRRILFGEGSVKSEEGMAGISPAFLQVKDQLEKSELFRSLRTQIAEYCGVTAAEKLSPNEVQNLAYSVADERAANAFRFSFRADLSNGMFITFCIGTIEKLAEFWRLPHKVWLATLLIYSTLAIGFAMRTWFYLDIRGRIIYPIGLAVLADYHREKESAGMQSHTITLTTAAPSSTNPAPKPQP